MKLLIMGILFLMIQSCGIKGKPLPPLPIQPGLEKQSSDTTKIKK